MSFASGIGAGIAIGIATGIAAGRKNARDALRKYIRINNLTIQDGSGEMVSIEDFLDKALVSEYEKNRALIFLGIGLLVLLLIGGVTLYLFLASGQ